MGENSMDPNFATLGCKEFSIAIAEAEVKEEVVAKTIRLHEKAKTWAARAANRKVAKEEL